jgi:hypothetical protein
MIAFFYGFIAVFFGTLLIAGILSNDDTNGAEPSSVSPSRQKETHGEITRLHSAQFLGDEADQYADNLLSYFRFAGVCDTYSSTIRRVGDTGSSVNTRITKMHEIMDKAHENNCVRY